MNSERLAPDLVKPTTHPVHHLTAEHTATTQYNNVLQMSSLIATDANITVGGGAVSEALAELRHRCEEGDVELLEAKMTLKGKLEVHWLADMSSTLLSIAL